MRANTGTVNNNNNSNSSNKFVHIIHTILKNSLRQLNVLYHYSYWYHQISITVIFMFLFILLHFFVWLFTDSFLYKYDTLIRLRGTVLILAYILFFIKSPIFKELLPVIYNTYPGHRSKYITTWCQVSAYTSRFYSLCHKNLTKL
jgi:hypothetical protein